MLESVARPAAEDPDIPVGGVSVNDEVMVGRVFVLADAALEQRRILHSWKPVREITACAGQSLFADESLSRGRVKFRAARIVGYFEASSLVAGDSVHEVITVVGPYGYVRLVVTRIANGCPEEKHFLLRREEMRTDRLRE